MDRRALPCEEWMDLGDPSYLRQALGRVLPSALAQVVQVQPADPIAYLALWLRKYRELNPLPSASINASGAEDQKPPTDSTTGRNYPVNEPKTRYPISAVECQSTYPVQIVQNCDDGFIEWEDLDYHGNTPLGKTVHSEVRSKFVDIGDLFDDDDVG